MVTTFRHNEIENIRVKKLNEAYALILERQPLDQQLSDFAALSYAGNAGKVAKVKADATGLEFSNDLTGSGGYTVATNTVSYTETATGGEKIGRVSGTMTVTLPTAVGNTAILHFKLIAAGTVTIDGAGTETIDGGLTATLTVVNTTLTLYSDNANWMII